MTKRQPKPKPQRTPGTETVRMPKPLALRLRDIAHAARKPVAAVAAELFADLIAERHAKLPKASRSV